MEGDRNERGIAAAFVEARRSMVALARFPGTPPRDLAGAYRVQDHALALWDRPVGGWKVGRIGAPEALRLGAERLVGPVFADAITEAGDAIRAMPVFAQGFAACEAEFMCRLSVDADRHLPRDDVETLDWIDEVRIGIEVASSPYPGINADGPCVTIADHGNNLGLLLGPALDPGLHLTLDQITVETLIDGHSVARATTATMLDGPLGAVRFLLANLSGRGITPQTGWWISSGAVTGVHEVQPGSRVDARFAGIGEVACTIIAAT